MTVGNKSQHKRRVQSVTFLIVMLNVFMLIDAMQNVVMLSFVMLYVMAPFYTETLNKILSMLKVPFTRVRKWPKCSNKTII